MLNPIRNLTKAAAESVLGVLSPIARRQRARRNDVLILAYHNIVPHGAAPIGERSLHLPQAVFAAQLDALMATHDVIRLADVLSGDGGASARPRAVITFDDAYRGALTAGIHELTMRRLPATFFVAPAFIPDGAFWWDLLADGWNGAIDAATREFAMNNCRGETERVREWARTGGVQLPQLPEHARAATLAELQSAAAQPGIDLGSHTWSHCNLSVVPPAEAESQLHRSREWLDENFGKHEYWLSYPYGNSTQVVERLAADAGYQGAVKIAGGWHHASRSGGYTIPRLNIPNGMTARGFDLRASGMITK